MSEMTMSSLDDAMKDPIPQMGKPSDTTVELLYGLPGLSGRETVAVVREMTGEDEEHMAALGERSDLSYAEYLGQLLKRVVVNVGDIDIQKNPSAVDGLIVGDRDLLFLGLIKATYGPTRQFSVTCGACGESNDLVIDIDKDFPVQGDLDLLKKPASVTLRDGSKVTLRLPTAEDSRIVSKRGKTVSEQNTIMIARCADVQVADAEQWARGLNIADRKALVNAMIDNKVGPSVEEVNDPCSYCGETISVVLDWVSLLYG